MIDNTDTIAAIATPPGRGGIGIIRISGPRALSIADSITGEKPVSRQAKYCGFKDSSGEILDTGIAIYFPAPASYTGEDVVELQGHGGQVILNCVLEQTLKLGARPARAGEFTERAFHNGKLDLLQAEAVADLIDSSSNEAARSAMRSLNGEFSTRIDVLLGDLIQIRVFVEGALDFPEEEIDKLSGSDVREKIALTLKQTNTILKEARQGQVLKDGINVAIIGPPNVGKSSLLNVLSRTDRAIVTPTPGTTRDMLEDNILIDGVPVNIVDTAGIRESNDSIEQEGIRRAWRAVEKADLVLLVKEAVAGPEEQQCAIINQIPQGKTRIVLYNKIDLLNMPAQIRNEPGDNVEVFISAKTEEGIGLLKEQIKQQMGLTDPAEVVLSGRARHIEALKRAGDFLKKAENNFDQNTPAAELIAEDLQQAQHWLETITGKSTPDDLLGDIFSQFCIGK